MSETEGEKTVRQGSDVEYWCLIPVLPRQLSELAWRDDVLRVRPGPQIRMKDVMWRDWRVVGGLRDVTEEAPGARRFLVQ